MHSDINIIKGMCSCFLCITEIVAQVFAGSGNNKFDFPQNIYKKNS